jgi:phosphoglycolate phosphatase
MPVNIIFDLDGTLIDSSRDIKGCLKTAYASELGLEVETKHLLIGPPLEDMIKNATPDLGKKQIRAVIRRFRQYYDNDTFPNTKLYAGVQELLAKLNSMNIRSYLVTNKPAFPTEKIIKKLQIENYFSDIFTLDRMSRVRFDKAEMVSEIINKWRMIKSKTLLVGDSESDIVAARINNIVSVAVLYGYGHKDILEKHKPNYLINDIAELYHIVWFS